MKTKKKIQMFRPTVQKPIKNLSWPQAKARFPLMNPYGDADGDRLKNKFDCKPFDKTRKGEEHSREDFTSDLDYQIYLDSLKQSEDLLKFGKKRKLGEGVYSYTN